MYIRYWSLESWTHQAHATGGLDLAPLAVGLDLVPLAGSLEPGLLVGGGRLAGVPLAGMDKLREGRHHDGGLELVPLAGVVHLDEGVCLRAGVAEDDPGLVQLAGGLDLVLLVGGDHLVDEVWWDKDGLVPLAGALVHVHLGGGLGDRCCGLRLQVLESWGPLVIAGVLVLGAGQAVDLVHVQAAGGVGDGPQGGVLGVSGGTAQAVYLVDVQRSCGHFQSLGRVLPRY